ncbi:MAG TPA: response regulator [Steroidobacteraceae bacterium]
MDTSPGCIRVLVAEDNADLSAALRALVEQEPDMELAGAVDRCGDLLGAVRDGRAHVVVLDLDLGGESSVGPMRAVLHEVPRLAVVLYSGYDRCDLARALPSLGNYEYVAKSGDAAELLTAIRRAARGTPGAGR